MKTIVVIALAAFFMWGCAKQELAPLTPEEQETAKNEIRDVVDRIFCGLEKLDAEALFQWYSDSSHFILITTEGSMVDLQRAKSGHAAWFKSFSSLKVTTVRDEFRFLPGEIVICAWLGKFEMTLKTGERLRIDKFGITFVFSKIDNHWLVMYQHSSALPPVQEKSQR